MSSKVPQRVRGRRRRHARRDRPSCCRVRHLAQLLQRGALARHAPEHVVPHMEPAKEPDREPDQEPAEVPVEVPAEAPAEAPGMMPGEVSDEVTRLPPRRQQHTKPQARAASLLARCVLACVMLRATTYDASQRANARPTRACSTVRTCGASAFMASGLVRRRVNRVHSFC